MVLQDGHHCVIIKTDINNVFRNIPVALHTQWLLDFLQGQETYQEAYLSFGLAKSLFIFNLFTKAIHQILQSSVGPILTIISTISSTYWPQIQQFYYDFKRKIQPISFSPIVLVFYIRMPKTQKVQSSPYSHSKLTQKISLFLYTFG